MRHRLIWLFATVVLLTVAAPLAHAEQDKATPEDTAEVQRLFKALSDDDFKVREDAREQLIGRGEGVLPQIKELARNSQDPETRASIDAIEATIEAGAIDRPTLVTLDFTD